MAVESKIITSGSHYTTTLGRIPRCMVCLEHKRHLSKKNPLSTEHIIPRQACYDHNMILGPIRGQWFNFTRLCRDHHDVAEARKEYKGRNDLPKLVVGVANYQRSPDKDLRDLQYMQWNKLFREIRYNILGLNGLTPPHFESLYTKTGLIIENILYKWEQGDFDFEFVP